MRLTIVFTNGCKPSCPACVFKSIWTDSVCLGAHAKLHGWSANMKTEVLAKWAQKPRTSQCALCAALSALKERNPAVTGADADWWVSVPGWSATAWWRAIHRLLGVSYRKTERRCVISAYKGLQNEAWRLTLVCSLPTCHLFLGRY